MYIGAPQFTGADSLACRRFDDFRTGNKHLSGFFAHENEVGQSGGINRAARKGPRMTEICGMMPEQRTFR